MKVGAGIALILLLWTASAFPQSSTGMTDADVAQMIKAGFSSSVVIAKIKSSSCDFDTSLPTLVALKKDGVPQDVIAAMISTPRAGDVTLPLESRLPAVPEAFRQKVKASHGKICPTCPIVVVVGLESDGTPMLGSMTKNQQEWFKKKHKEVTEYHSSPNILFSTDWEDAIYLVTSWSGSRSYSYSYLFPHTTTSTTNIYGDVAANATTTTTSLQPISGVRHIWVYQMRIYDRKTGTLLYSTIHTGKFRWSKPDRDCLEDVYNYLVGEKKN